MNMMDWVGQTLGQYRIEAPLDAGGMGQVFRGIHTYLNRPAAIKVMKTDLAINSTFRARFLQEAQSAAALKHPNIVDIYEFNEQGGHFYLVMELMADGSLRSLLHRRISGKPWPLSLGLDLVRQAAEGLAAAHAQGIIHRDIKPGNLLLNRLSQPGQEPEQYQLKIGDFGLARLAEGSGLTVTGRPMGTLPYMSPEQCLSKKLDGRSDLYALGIVLYEIATGHLPFQIESFEDALHKHPNVAPLPLRQIRSDVPQIVEEITLRCLAKKSEERYATCTALAQELRRALGDAQLETVRSPCRAGNIINSRPHVAHKDISRHRSSTDTAAPCLASGQWPRRNPRGTRGADYYSGPTHHGQGHIAQPEQSGGLVHADGAGSAAGVGTGREPTNPTQSEHAAECSSRCQCSPHCQQSCTQLLGDYQCSLSRTDERSRHSTIPLDCAPL